MISANLSNGRKQKNLYLIYLIHNQNKVDKVRFKGDLPVTKVNKLKLRFLQEIYLTHIYLLTYELIRVIRFNSCNTYFYASDI